MMLTRLIVVLISQYIEFLLYTWNQHNVICQLGINLKKTKITPQSNKQTKQFLELLAEILFQLFQVGA